MDTVLFPTECVPDQLFPVAMVQQSEGQARVSAYLQDKDAE